MLCDQYAPVVFLNDGDTKSARIFTLAHELVHVWMGLDGVFNLDKMMPAKEETEQFCNQVAAEFLVPAYKLTDRWGEAKATKNPFHTMAGWFKVSPVVVARRALDLKLITNADFFRFFEQDQADWLTRKQDFRQKSSGGNFYATQNVRLGRRFSAAVVRAAREGRILYQDAFRLTGMKGATFSAYADLVLKRMRDERESTNLSWSRTKNLPQRSNARCRCPTFASSLTWNTSTRSKCCVVWRSVLCVVASRSSVCLKSPAGGQVQSAERLVNSKRGPAKERGPGGVQCQRTSQS